MPNDQDQFNVLRKIDSFSKLTQRQLANKLGCKAIGFSGKGGGELNALCEVNIVIPSEDIPRIQKKNR